MQINPHLLTALLFCAAAVSTSADIITVTNTNDNGPGSLRQALAVANDGDTIDFAVTGTITLTSGELLVDKSISISGPGGNNLAVDGDAFDRVLHVGSGRVVTMSGLTIRNGRTFGNNYPDDSGGGIYNDHATLTLSNCTISNNWAYTRGGGVYNDHASLMVNDCIVSDNFSDNAGGGLYHDGSNGSAIAQINNSTFLNNSSYGGGAVFSNGESGVATLVVTTTVISGNSVILDGGGISNDHSHVTLNSCTISGNSADGNGGGGIFNRGDTQDAAILEISNSTLNGNSSQFNGGAIYSTGDILGMATVQIVNSTLSGNSAVGVGGAVYNRGTFGTGLVQIGNSTLSDNLAQSGDSIYNFIQMGFPGTVVAELSGSIFNAGASGQNFFNNGGMITSHGYNLSDDNGGGYLSEPGDQINTDPLLGPLQNNGGPTFTHALLPGSPAIDTGDQNFTPPPFFDQRGPGYPRIVSRRIDKGSFEVQGPTPTPTATSTPTPTPTATSTPIPTATATATFSPTATPTATFTPIPTASPTATPTSTLTPTPTATATHTPTATPTATRTPTPTPTATRTPTPTPTPTSTPTHSAFFSGEVLLGNGVYYLQFPNGTPFGYYSYLTDQRFIYHFDLGYEYWFDANDGHSGIYFYDFMSTHFFYTSPSFPFPYLYDFSLNTVLYYYPDPNRPGHYTTNPRYFYNFATGQIITL